MGIKEIAEEIILGGGPIGAGVVMYDKNIFLSIILILFGMGIIYFFTFNFLKREKVMRSAYGYGYLSRGQ